MKITALFFFILPAAVLALPAEQAQNSGIDPNRKFQCPAKVKDFCSASNIRSGCTSDGEFKSNAMDTCSECTCP